MEKAADDFATKFPESELRVLLYKAAMRGYQNANNGDKMAEMAQKLLKLDPDDPEALIASAEVLAEHTRSTDLDKDQRFDQASKYAQHALETVDTDVPAPANVPQAQLDAYKGLSTVHGLFGARNHPVRSGKISGRGRIFSQVDRRLSLAAGPGSGVAFGAGAG